MAHREAMKDNIKQWDDQVREFYFQIRYHGDEVTEINKLKK